MRLNAPMRIESEPWRFAPESLALLDRVAERIAPDDEGLAAWCAKYTRQHRERLAGDLRLLEGVASSGARVLEYGAVPLLMTAALAERGFDVSALDVGPERFARAIEALGLDVRRCDVETEPVPFDTGAFDVVLFNEIFEHLRINPLFTLREVLRVLRPGGQLLLSTPNLRSLRGLKNLLLDGEAYAASADVYRQYEKLETLGHMGHVREYTTKEVTQLLTRIGFEVESVVYRGGHGRGPTGVVERLAPSWRPFFAVCARKPVAPRAGAPA